MRGGRGRGGAEYIVSVMCTGGDTAAAAAQPRSSSSRRGWRLVPRPGPRAWSRLGPLSSVKLTHVVEAIVGALLRGLLLLLEPLGGGAAAHGDVQLDECLIVAGRGVVLGGRVGVGGLQTVVVWGAHTG